MMRKLNCGLLLYVLLFGLHVFSGQSGRILGTVQMADGTKLPGATVLIEGTNISATTDKNGDYLLTTIVHREIILVVSLDGFETQKKTVIVPSQQTVVINFTLEPRKLSAETTVTAERPLLSTSEEASKITLTPSQIETLPSLGEKDIFRAFQLLPGVSGSHEASSGLYVRGGTPDQNLILYDGFTIYHVDHLFGYFSAFNMEAVHEAQLSKGGFDANYGGRISSVMDLIGKTGDSEKLRFGAGLSLLSFNGLVEVPVLGMGSFFLAGRRSFQGPLYDKILNMFDTTPGGGGGMVGRQGGGRFGASFDTQPSSYFYDLNAKLALLPSTQDHLALSFYNGKDDLDNSRSLEIPDFMIERMAERGIELEGGDIDIIDLRDWGNTGTSLNWARDWNDIFQSRFTLAYSNYFNTRDRSGRGNFIRPTDSESDDDDTPEPRIGGSGAVEDNNVQDLTFKWENDLHIFENNTIEFGAQITSNDISYAYDLDLGEENEDSEDTDDETTGQRNLLGILNREDKGTLFAGYLLDRWILFDKLILTPGLRVTYFDYTAETYLEPRFSLHYNITDQVRLKGAWGKYYQFVKRVTREDMMQGDREFWALANGQNIPVSCAYHYIAGVSYETPEFLLDIEAYYKDLSGLSEFALRFGPQIQSEETDYEDYLFQGTGISKGIEFLLQKKFGKYTGWVGYTLGQVEYNFPDIKDEPYPALHDQRHEFKIVNSYEINRWTFAGTWIYASGKPYTEPAGIEEVTINDRFTLYQVIPGEKNEAKLPSYHRLDLSVTYDLQLGNTNSTAGLTLFNVYNRKNVWYKEYETLEGELIENNILYMSFTVNVFFSIKF